jgi:hypothetical protein
MAYLLVPTQMAQAGEALVRFGGLPSAPNTHDFAWPRCSFCKGLMQFLAQVPLTEKERGLVFMCQNQPGLCDEWAPDAGGNAVIVVPVESPVAIQPPSQGETTLPFQMDLGVLLYEQAYEAALRDPALKRSVLGKLYGTPDWIQADETPLCNACGAAMRFVGQFEQATDGKAEMNFGGGLAYLFSCSCTSTSAKFLWQC